MPTPKRQVVALLRSFETRAPERVAAIPDPEGAITSAAGRTWAELAG